MTQHQLPRGFRAVGVACGLKKTGDLDLAVVASDEPCAAAAVFTRNAFPAAPVLYDRALLSENPHAWRAVAINAGIANACTGQQGLEDAVRMAATAEQALGLPARSCAVMSTGVIGPRLPMEKIEAGIAAAAPALAEDGWETAARAIMTTDTRPKTAFRQIGACRLFGMAKGAGMIHPDMATMLSVILTDAELGPEVLDVQLRPAVDQSFNSISVDGDTSTNDTVLLMANGAAGPVDGAAFRAALTDLCADLAQQIVRDGEGATRFITIQISHAATDDDARRAAHAVANSPLVKTAVYGGDANWGRILAAVGYSGAQVEPARVGLWVSAAEDEPVLQLVQRGQPTNYAETEAAAIFARPEIFVHVDLGLGAGQARVWTCDLSHEYVSINGHYRS